MEIDVFFLYSLPLASRLRTYIVVVCARTHRFNVVQRNCAFFLSQEILPSSWKTIADTLRMCFFSSLCVVFIFVLSFSFYVFEFDIFRHNCFMCRCSFFFSLRFLSCALWFFMLYFLFTKIILFYFFSFEIHSSFYYCLFLYATDHLYRSVCRFNFDLIHAFFFNFFLWNKKKVEGKKTRTHTQNTIRMEEKKSRERA